jgi:hypothetical protein
VKFKFKKLKFESEILSKKKLRKFGIETGRLK